MSFWRQKVRFRKKKLIQTWDSVLSHSHKTWVDIIAPRGKLFRKKYNIYRKLQFSIPNLIPLRYDFSNRKSLVALLFSFEVHILYWIVAYSKHRSLFTTVKMLLDLALIRENSCFDAKWSKNQNEHHYIGMNAV